MHQEMVAQRNGTVSSLILAKEKFSEAPNVKAQSRGKAAPGRSAVFTVFELVIHPGFEYAPANPLTMFQGKLTISLSVFKSQMLQKAEYLEGCLIRADQTSAGSSIPEGTSALGKTPKRCNPPR